MRFLLRQAGWKSSAHGGAEFSSVYFRAKNNLCVHPAEQAGLHVCNRSGNAKGNNYVTTFNLVWVCDYKSNLYFYNTWKRLSEISANPSFGPNLDQIPSDPLIICVRPFSELR